MRVASFMTLLMACCTGDEKGLFYSLDETRKKCLSLCGSTYCIYCMHGNFVVRNFHGCNLNQDFHEFIFMATSSNENFTIQFSRIMKLATCGLSVILKLYL